jgi:hypothetical protein
MAFQLTCDGTVSVLPDGSPTCSGVWILVQAPIPFSLDQLDPSQVGLMIGAGYGAVLSVWLTSRGIRALLELLRTQFPH